MLEDKDFEFAENVAYEVNTDWVKSTFSHRYGRGWQKKLAANISIAESTLSTWLKNKDIPAWAQLAIGALTLRRDSAKPTLRRVVQDGERFAIYDFEGTVGQRIADNIPTEKAAFMMAAAWELSDACSQATWIFYNASFDDEYSDILEQVEKALGLASPPSKRGAEEEKTDA